MSDYCEIVVKGQLDMDWSGWLEGLTITHNERDYNLQDTTLVCSHYNHWGVTLSSHRVNFVWLPVKRKNNIRNSIRERSPRLHATAY
jgi:hypothetical protein